MAEPSNQSTQQPPPEAQQEIAQAAAQTAAAGGSQAQVAGAAQDAAREQGYQLTDEQAKQIAAALSGPLVDGLLDGMEKRGVFRDEPEPVQPPPAAAAAAPADVSPPASAAEVPHAAAPGEQPPQKSSWAERHFG